MFTDLSLPRVRVLCLPDLNHPIGGVKQLYRHVEHLDHLGWDAAVVTENDGFRPSWFHSTATTFGIKSCIRRNEFSDSNTILVLPETYIGVNMKSFYGVDLSHLPSVIFNQNAYYTFGDFLNISASSVNDFYDNPHVLQVLCVSEDTSRFLSSNLNLNDSKVSRIVNAIEPAFTPFRVKKNKFHWMPRKNKDHVHAIIQSIQRGNFPHAHDWIGEPLVNLPHDQIADCMNTAKLFLSFGHPEGFGLPIAEAMASGCWVVGYSGGGGNELFRFGASSEVTFGDWGSFADSIRSALYQFHHFPRQTHFLLQRQSLAVRTLYSEAEELTTIKNAWQLILKQFNVLNS